jgi:nitronate monooxygenase
MGGVATAPALPAAVAGAGGHGMLAAVVLPPPMLAGLLDATAAAAQGQWGVNFLLPLLDRDCVAVAAARADYVDFFYGEPDAALVDEVHARGALAGWQVGSAAEARQAEAAGCDLVVAQGVEAGGHVRGTLGLLPLLAEVLEAVEVPVVAAGGLASARATAAAFAAGADAVRVGTAFIPAEESAAHPEYVEAVLRAGPGDAVLTEVFSLGWPDAPHRVLRSAVEAATAFEGDVVGELAFGPERIPLPRFSVATPTEDTTGSVAAMPLYAGQGVGAVSERRPAADIVHELTAGAARLLGAAAGGTVARP